MLGEKRCYAVMPYGGEDEEKQKLYMLIYQLYIRIPAEDMGYMVEREDLSDDGGNIFTNVIEHLAEDDLVLSWRGRMSELGGGLHPSGGKLFESGAAHRHYR